MTGVDGFRAAIEKHERVLAEMLARTRGRTLEPEEAAAVAATRDLLAAARELADAWEPLERKIAQGMRDAKLAGGRARPRRLKHAGRRRPANR
jgi:hypothetical protein